MDHVGDPASRASFTVTADLSPFAGQTVRLRLAGVHTQFYLLAGVDDVRIDSSAPYAGQVADDGPLAWYRLGEASGSAMLDSAGSHHGNCQNGVTNGAAGAIAGDPNTARVFDGRAAYCYVNGIAAPPGAYTLEGWVKLSALSPGTIVDHGGGALYVQSDRYCVRQTSTTVCRLHAPDPGAWHHVGTWSAADATARLYVDGVLVASAPSTAAPSGSSTLYVGYGQSAPWFTGTLDEIAYYPTALSAGRIAAHYHAGCGC